MTERFYKQLKQETQDFGISLDERQIEQFYTYYEMLIETNKVMNLTAITEENEVVTKHFTDSLSLVRVLGEALKGDISLIDVGTGAGFPGVPLNIAFPQIKLTLLDSLNKRVKFLQEVCQRLGLEGAVCVHGRAEDAGRQKEHRESYDVCVSRAVANMASLSEYCMPFVKVGGCFIPYKSGEIDRELEQGRGAVAVLGGEVQQVERFTLPGSDAARSLIAIRKVKGISKKYPRKAGIPGKEPLS